MNLTKRLHNLSDILKHFGFCFFLGLIITSFSNDSKTDKKSNSKDGGKTWPLEKIIYEGSFAYSCLTKKDNSTAGLLFERDGYEKISYSILPISWLEDK